MIRVPPRRHRLLPVLLLSVFSILYLAASSVSFLNEETVNALSKMKVGDGFADTSLRRSYLHDAAYFRELAQRLQFYPHRTNIVDECYGAALRKAPADYKNFSSYARYIEMRGCCKETLASLTRGMVARSPQNPDNNMRAAQLFLDMGDRETALRYFYKAQEAGATLSPENYKSIETGGKGVAELFSATPRRFPALLNLAGYLYRKSNAEAEFRRSLNELDSLAGNASQRIALARLALQSGDLTMARKEALEAQRAGTNPMASLQLLADIAAEQQDWTEYRNLSAQMRDLYRSQGKEEQSCEAALKSVGKRGKKPAPDVAMRLTKIVEAHPDCVPAYVRLAEALEPDSRENAEVYLKKAAAMAPQSFEVGNKLAQIYIKQKKYTEAEAIYVQFLDSPDFSQAAYLGLAHCRFVQGNYPSAELALKEGIERNDDSEELWRELGRIYAKEGSLPDAADAFSHYASLTPDKPEGFLLAGDAYKKMGRKEAARRQYQKALDADSENRRALDSIRSLDELR